VLSAVCAKGMQRSSKALTLMALLAAVATLHSFAPVLGFVGLAPVSSGLRSVGGSGALPTRAWRLARAAAADGEDGDAAKQKKRQLRLEMTQELVAAMPDLKAEDLEVGQIVKGISRQPMTFGQIVSLGKGLRGLLPFIEATDNGWMKKPFRAGLEREFRVLAKTTALGADFPVLLTARSGDLTRPPSMFEDMLFASPQELVGTEQDLSAFAGIAPETWLEATVVNTAVPRGPRPARVVVTLTAPGGSKQIAQGIPEKALLPDLSKGPIVFGSKLKVRVVEVDIKKSRLKLTMLEKTLKETKE